MTKLQYCSHPPTLALLAAASLLAGAAHAATVMPPPLPPGSNLAVVNVGVNPEESKRSVRAHHHKGHNKKDYTRDDSAGLTVDGEGNVTNNGNGNGNGNAYGVGNNGNNGNKKP